MVAEFVGMENIYSAEIVIKGTDQYAHVGSLDIHVISALRGKVRVGIRPEDIIITKEDFFGSAQIQWRLILSDSSPRTLY